MSKTKIGIINVTGYAGIELARLLHGHPEVEITSVTGRSAAGQPLGAVFPHLSHLELTVEEALGEVDIVFSAMPHKESAEVILPLQKKYKEAFDPRIKQAYQLHKGLKADLDTHLVPLKEAEKIVKPKMLSYQRKVSEDLEKERAKREAEARKKAEAERKRELERMKKEGAKKKELEKAAAKEIEVDVPNNVVLELKVEEEDKKGKTQRSLEIEIEWYDGDEAQGPVTLG